MNYIFVDYQNVMTVDPAVLASNRASVTLVLGRQNHSLDIAVVQKLMAGPATVELIKIERDGRDAVDFTLAYYLGQKVLNKPKAFFHIVSKDKGYDPLIEHLRSQRIKIRRHDTYGSLIDALKPKTASAPAARKTPVE